MLFKIPIKWLLMALSLSALVVSGTAYAGTPFATVPIAGDGQIYEFSGPLDISYAGIDAECTVTVDGHTDAAGGTFLTTSLGITGSSFCSGVTISSLGTGEVSNVSSDGATVTFSNVEIAVAGLFDCGYGTLTLYYNNGASVAYLSVPQQMINNCEVKSADPLIIVPAASYSADLSIVPNS